MNARKRQPRKPLNFDIINAEALTSLPALLTRWLPDGRIEGSHYVARNPTRDDRRPGSFKIRLRDCVWKDFATGDGGGDPVSLTAYIHGLSQCEAAMRLRDMLGVSNDR